MKQFSKIGLLALGFGLLAVAMSSFPSHSVTAAPPGPPSIPVDVTNTPNVNVTNTPSVNATITNTPTVALASGTTVGLSGSVSVSNFPSSQSVSFNGTAQPVTLTKQLVTLVCAAFTSNICTDLERVAADGTLTPFTAQPTGLVLVVTDFVWKSASVTPGQVAFATLHHQLTSPPHDVAFSAVVATPDGAAVSESNFTSGLQFSDVPVVFVSNTPNEAILQGYLAAP
jgi:hypothetical protein